LRKSASRSRTSNEKQGLLLLLSAPSGCGKTTLVNRLLDRHPEWVRSVSVTTRPARLGERPGEDYEFVSPKEFESLKRKKEFLESAKIFGQCYGTRRGPIERALKDGRHVILAIDIQGARSVRREIGRKIPFFSVFVLPPSTQVLRERLEGRKTDSSEEIEKRIDRAKEEIKAAGEYDATVINRDLDQTVRDLEGMISAFEKKRKGGK
jgi:guanylate kinase